MVNKIQKDKNKQVVKDKTFFDEYIDIETGKVLQKNEFGEFYYEVEKENEQAEKVVVQKDNVVNVLFNDKVYDRIIKYTKTILGLRGIKSTDNIDEKDRDVADLIKNAKRRKKGRPISKQEISAIVERVKREHEPHYTLALFQIITWAIVYDNIFKVISGGQLECRFDIEIPEDYWDNVKKSGVDPLDALMNDYIPPSPFFDSENPLELMVAITSTLTNEYTAFLETLQNYIKKAYVGIGVLNASLDYDDATFLITELDSVLS